MAYKGKNTPSLFKLYNKPKTECLKVYEDSLVFMPNETFASLLIKEENSLIFEIPYENITDVSITDNGKRNAVTVLYKTEDGEEKTSSISYSGFMEKTAVEIVDFVKSKIQ